MPGWLESLLLLVVVPFASGFLVGRRAVIAAWPLVWLGAYVGYERGWWETTNESVDVALLFDALLSTFFAAVGVFTRARG